MLITGVLLRPVKEADLATFFEHQLDSSANHMAAFTREDPSDRDGFMAHWAKILTDDTVTPRTILFDGEVAGHIASFERFGQLEVTYWIGQEYWGKGIVTEALLKFLKEFETRPLCARAAKDNLASIRVLEKCGFKVTGHDKSFAHARGKELEEVVLTLGA